MKIPRNIAPVRVIILLRSLGYKLGPQTGAHIRLSRPGNTITFLNESPIEPRTLRGIIAEVSHQAFVPADTLIGRL